MGIKIIKKPISRDELKKAAEELFGDMVKAVVDVEQEIMAIGGELHADEEVALSDSEGSKREFVWGINLYPDSYGDDFIEFDSMVNLKPGLGNPSRFVQDVEIKSKICNVVKRLITG